MAIGTYQMSNFSSETEGISPKLLFLTRDLSSRNPHIPSTHSFSFLFVLNQITGCLSGTPCLPNAISCHSCDSLNLAPSTFSNKASEMKLYIYIFGTGRVRNMHEVSEPFPHTTFGHFVLISLLSLWKAETVVEFTIPSALKSPHWISELRQCQIPSVAQWILI